MQNAVTTYRVLTYDGEPIYQTTNADIAHVESESGHRVTAVSQPEYHEEPTIDRLGSDVDVIPALNRPVDRIEASNGA